MDKVIPKFKVGEVVITKAGTVSTIVAIKECNEYERTIKRSVWSVQSLSKKCSGMHYVLKKNKARGVRELDVAYVDSEEIYLKAVPALQVLYGQSRLRKSKKTRS